MAIDKDTQAVSCQPVKKKEKSSRERKTQLMFTCFYQ